MTGDATLERVAADAGLPAPVVQQALEWLVVAWSREASQEELAALAQWRAAHEQHEQAWRHVARIGEQLSALEPEAAAEGLRSSAQMASRRRFLAGLLGLGAVGVVGWQARHAPFVQSHLADIATSTGEIRRLTLADGTRLVVNTASAVNVRFTDTERRLELVTGEILVETAPDAASSARPFVVDTEPGTVRPIGTRFSVRHTRAPVEVAVLAGAVRLDPRATTGAPMRLAAGERAEMTASAASPQAGRAHADWVEGRISAEQMRLGDLVAELARYRTGILRCDPAVADLPVSGSFPVTDTDRALRALAEALPVRISAVTRYWVTVTQS